MVEHRRLTIAAMPTEPDDTIETWQPSPQDLPIACDSKAVGSGPA